MSSFYYVFLSSNIFSSSLIFSNCLPVFLRNTASYSLQIVSCTPLYFSFGLLSFTFRNFFSSASFELNVRSSCSSSLLFFLHYSLRFRSSYFISISFSNSSNIFSKTTNLIILSRMLQLEVLMYQKSIVLFNIQVLNQMMIIFTELEEQEERENQDLL